MTSDITIALVILIFLAIQNIKAFLLFTTLIILTIFLYDRLFKSTLPGLGKSTNDASTKMLKGFSNQLMDLEKLEFWG